MKPNTASIVLVGITIVFAAAVAASAAPPKAAPVVQKSLFQMTPAELAQLQIPPGSSLQIRRVSARTSVIPNLVGPDLVVLDPIYEGPKQAPPGWYGSGYYVDWYIMNQGTLAAGPTKVKFDCEVVGGTPGSALNQYLTSQSCNSFNQQPRPIPGLKAGQQLPAAGAPYPQWGGIRLFIPPPIVPCSSAYPRARFTATVDPDNTVAETAAGETNNVYVAEICYAP